MCLQKSEKLWDSYIHNYFLVAIWSIRFRNSISLEYNFMKILNYYLYLRWISFQEGFRLK